MKERHGKGIEYYENGDIFRMYLSYQDSNLVEEEIVDEPWHYWYSSGRRLCWKSRGAVAGRKRYATRYAKRAPAEAIKYGKMATTL